MIVGCVLLCNTNAEEGNYPETWEFQFTNSDGSFFKEELTRELDTVSEILKLLGAPVRKPQQAYGDIYEDLKDIEDDIKRKLIEQVQLS